MVRFQMFLPTHMLEGVDGARGQLSRAAFIRGAVDVALGAERVVGVPERSAVRPVSVVPSRLGNVSRSVFTPAVPKGGK